MKIENEASAPVAVSYMASAAAIFIGCVCTMARPSWSPESVVRMPDATIIQSPNLRAGRMVTRFWLRARCQAATVMMRPAATMNDAKIVCGKAASATLFVSSAQMSVSSARPRASFSS